MTKRILIRNSIVGVIQLILTAGLTFLSVPVFISKLGLELYGVFSTISIVGNLNVLSNLGLNSALLIYLSSQGKCKESNYDIAVTQIIMLFIIIVLSIPVIVFRNFIVLHILSVPEEYLSESSSLLVLLVLANSLLLLGQTYTSIIDSQQKIYITNILQFVYSLFYWGGIIIIVCLGGGLLDIGLVITSAALLWFVSIFICAKISWGKLYQSGLLENFKRIAYKQISYGMKIYTSGLISFLFEPLSKILLANMVGMNSVAIFDIAIKIRGQINGLATKAIYPICPYIASTPTSAELNRKVFNLSKLIQIFAIPIAVIAFFALPSLLNLWLGANNSFQITVFVCFMTSFFILVFPSLLPVYQYFIAKGMAHIAVWMQGSAVIINMIVFLLSFKYLGLYAILLSNSLGYLASYLVCSHYEYRVFQMPFQQEYYLKLLLLLSLCALPCMAINAFFGIKYWGLVIYPLIITVLFIIGMRKVNILTFNEVNGFINTSSYVGKFFSKHCINITQ